MQNLHDLIITDIKAVEVRQVPFSVGLVPPWNPTQRITTRDYVVVRIDTNAGFSAIALDGDYTPALPARAKDVEILIKPEMVGKRVMDMETHGAFLHSLRSRGRFFFIAVGLWDIVGKAVGIPLYQLWGGKIDHVLVYASTVQHGRSPAERADDCRRYLDQGYKAVKLRLSADNIEDDLTLVAACRDAIGDNMDIMVDANQAGKGPGSSAPGAHWDYTRALETAKHLKDYEVAYLEEPLAYVLEDEGAQLKEKSPVPIAGGEGKHGIQAYHHLIHKNIYDILQPDPIVSGTPTDMLKIRAMAEAADCHVIYHHGKSGYGFMIGLHLSTAFGLSPWLEYMDDGPFWQPAGFQVGFRKVIPVDAEGYVHCPQTPGLGIDWDEAWLSDIGLGK